MKEFPTLARIIIIGISCSYDFKKIKEREPIRATKKPIKYEDL
jgi:hypothetical protein